MKTKFLFITLLLLSINNGILIPQPQKRLREVAVTEELNQYFQDYYSGMYRVGDIVDIDSLRGDKKYLYKSIQNPYGMLTNSFVFVTDVNIDYYEGMDGNRIGTYKEGNILWLSEPDFPGGGGGRIFAIDDINLDGTVEIITEWDYGVVSLEIYSWDGVSGKLLNSEPIIGKEFNMSFVDVEGDGILEIISVDRSQVTDVWSWNGSEYGQWSNTPVVSLSELYPANNFLPNVKCNITKHDSYFTYRYSVKNDEQSKQRIELFWVNADVKDSLLVKKSPAYWISSGYSNNFEGWETPVLNDGYLIWPGEIKYGFEFITQGLPVVSIFAMQAQNALPDYYLLDQQVSLELMQKDMSENMVWGETVGPREAVDTLNFEVFLDTLLTFNTRSSELGWITNQTTADKYDGLFNTAKAQLEQNDNNAARKTLQTVLQEVDIDSTENLTSEAYALLRYNTEYLFGKIPAQLHYDLNEITPAMSMKNHPGQFTMELMGSGFTSNSVVYFNGNEKTTTFISGSTINAEILESDVSSAGNFPVWVSDGTAFSDTLMFSVVNNLPNEILPVMNCVTNNGDGTYTAFFGYDNQNSEGVFIPVYAQNKISPEPWDRGQPGVFKVGVQERVFSVTWTSGNIIWHLNNNTATAKTNSPPCN